MKYLLIIICFSYISLSQQSYVNLIKYKQDSLNTLKGIRLSLGAGPSVINPSIVISPNIIFEIFEHFNASAGVDIYTGEKKFNLSYSINIIPYYTLRSNRTIFQIGAGIANTKGTIVPIFSTRFDYELLHNNYLGIELKSLLTYGTDPLPGPVILLNYSIRL